MTKILSKKYLEMDCVEAAKERLRHLYKTYDKVIVNLSGGKDSNALLYITIEVARELGKLPVETIFADGECDGLDTIELIQQIGEMPEVDLKWFCLPFALRNACSSNSPLWYCWHPQEKDLWVRPMPEKAITELEGFVFEYDPNYQHPDGEPYKALGVTKSMAFQEVCELYARNYERKGYSVISLIGLRAMESLARFGVMARKKSECYISGDKAYPIYDWAAKDVWKYIRQTGLPYNKEYDAINRTDYYGKLEKQRVGSIFGEESLRGLYIWYLIYRDFWHKILDRAEGAKTAWRYCNDGIYRGTRVEKEAGVSWSDYIKTAMSKMSPETRAISQQAMKKVIQWHKGRTDYPIAENQVDACPLTGISWEFLANVAIRGDTKERKLQQVTRMAMISQNLHNITRDEAVEKYGNEAYKRKYYAKQKETTRREANALGTPTMAPQERSDA